MRESGGAPASGARGTLHHAKSAGILSHDLDGTGAGTAIAIAQILGAATVAAGDFIVALRVNTGVARHGAALRGHGDRHRLRVLAAAVRRYGRHEPWP